MFEKLSIEDCAEYEAWSVLPSASEDAARPPSMELVITSAEPSRGEEFEFETVNGYAVVTVSLRVAPVSADGAVTGPDVLTVAARVWEDGMDIEDGEAVSTVERLASLMSVEPETVAEELRALLMDRWVGGAERSSERALMAR